MMERMSHVLIVTNVNIDPGSAEHSMTHPSMFQYEILFCIQDLEDNDSFLYIQVRTTLLLCLIFNKHRTQFTLCCYFNFD